MTIDITAIDHKTTAHSIYQSHWGGCAPPDPPAFSWGGGLRPPPQTPPPEFHEGQAPQTPHTENIGLT